FNNLLFLTGAESHPALGPIIQISDRDPDLSVVATQNRLVGDLSDHHVFRVNGVPYLFLSCGRWQHYHAITDTPDRLNYRKMERVHNFLLCVIEALAATDLGPAQETDTTDLEITLLKKAFGPGLDFLLELIGLPVLATRQDLDALAFRLQDLFHL